MKISVFITSFNQKAYLVEAIESVLQQTLPPHQIIIVDDCSQDGSQEVIAGYASRYPEQVTPIYHAENLGVAQTRIDALEAVTGEYVTYVDGDDRFLPTKLEKEANLLRARPGVQIAFSNNYYMTGNGVRTGIWADNERPPDGDVFLRTFARDFPRQSLFRMELVHYQTWKEIGFHDSSLHLYEDFDMRIRLTKHCRTAYYDEPLSEIRVHYTGLSSLQAPYHLAALDCILRKNLPLLDAVTARQRRETTRKLKTWMAGIAGRAAWQELEKENSDRTQALSYYLCYLRHGHRIQLGFFLKLLLPRTVRRFLRKEGPVNRLLL